MSRTGYQLILDLSGPDGNAFVVMGKVTSVLRKFNPTDNTLVKEYQAEAMSGDYENLLKVSNEYVDLIDSSNMYSGILGTVKINTIVTKVER